MTSEPLVGEELGTFETTVDVDFGDRLEAILTGAPRRRDVVLPGAFVFFSFLDDFSWMERTGVSFDRSLAVRRRLRIHDPIRPGDRLAGRSVVADVVPDRRGRARTFVTIGTEYRRDGHLVLEESVTYVNMSGEST